MPAPMQAVPEQGQLVEVRSRPFVVNEIAKSTLSVDLLDVKDLTQRR